MTRGVKPMLVDVIWPNAPALVGMPCGCCLTVQPLMLKLGSEKFGVLEMLNASARNDSLYFSVIGKSLNS
jgi:hypothetical protein